MPNDWERVHLYASIPEFSQFEVWGPNTVEDTKEFVARCISDTSSDPIISHQLAVELREDNLLVGGCTLKLEGFGASEGYLGYAINPDYKNRGFATEAAIALIEFGFDQLHLVRIHSLCDTRNIASRRVMEKAGLQRTALNQNERERKGRMTDSYCYEIRPPSS